MKVVGLLLSLYLGVLLSSLYAFVVAEGGLLHQRALERHEALLENNIDDLAAINAVLSDEMRTLSTDVEAIRLLARELGFYREDERIMRVAGLTAERSPRTVGRIIRRRPPEAPLPAGGPVGAFLVMLPVVLFLTFGLARRSKATRTSDRRSRA